MFQIYCSISIIFLCPVLLQFKTIFAVVIKQIRTFLNAKSKDSFPPKLGDHSQTPLGTALTYTWLLLSYGPNYVWVEARYPLGDDSLGQAKMFQAPCLCYTQLSVLYPVSVLLTVPEGSHSWFRYNLVRIFSSFAEMLQIESGSAP